MRTVTDGMPDGLLGLATALVGIPSVSHHEGAMADAVQAALELCPWLEVDRVGDNVVARTNLGRERRVLLAGHLDTVPPAEGNDEPYLEGSTLYGLGAADMKGGLAVFLHLAGTLSEPAVDVTWCFYAGEEVAKEFNGLGHLWEQRPDLLAADAAILGEPTGGLVEAGCQGTLRVRVRLAGQRAHTARPHTGSNAIHRLAPVLTAVAGFEVRRPVIDGCEYAEQLQVVSVEGGVAANVVPDEAVLVINHRFAPDRTVEQAESAVRSGAKRWLITRTASSGTTLAATPPSTETTWSCSAYSHPSITGRRTSNPATAVRTGARRWMALLPVWGRAVWARRPARRTRTRNVPWHPASTSPPVGSPRMAASAARRSGRCSHR